MRNSLTGHVWSAGFPLLSFATLFIERVMDSFQHAVICPQIEVVADRASRRQVFRDRAIDSRSKDVLRVAKLEAVADRGYYSGEEILACDKAGIAVTLPKPMTSG
jgi:transposase